MSLSTTLSLNLQTTQALANDNFATNTDNAVFPYTGETFATGTAASQADLVYRARRTVTASSNITIDLAGSLADRFGTTITMARVKMIALYNRAAIGSGLVIGIGAGSNPLINFIGDASDIINLRPGGVLLLSAPDATAYAVTAATGDILKLTNPGGTDVAVDVMIVGASA